VKKRRAADKRLYEAMFVVEPQVAATRWEQVAREIEGVLLRHGGTIVRLDRWDERKLAYPIKKRSRAGYALCYFEAPPPAIEKLRAEFVLSETILRHLILIFEGTLKDKPPAPAPPPAVPVEAVPP
jgi:small subunit ribosomal protein S6